MTRRTALGLTLGGFATAAAPPQHAVFQSTDRGRSWMRADLGLPGEARVNAFAFTGAAIFTGTDVGIFVSRNRSQSWQPASASAGRILSFAAAGDAIFAGTDKQGLLVSADGGVTWRRDPGFPGQTVRSLLAVGSAVYAGTDSQGAFVKLNERAPWSAINVGLPEHAQLFAMAAVNGQVFSGLYARGLYRWAEGEHRWRKTAEVVPLSLAHSVGALIAGHNPGGIWRSDDVGQTWTQGAGDMAANSPIWALSAGPGAPVFAGADSGIYFSGDQGRTWSRARMGLPAESPGIAFLVTAELVLAGVILKHTR